MIKKLLILFVFAMVCMSQSYAQSLAWVKTITSPSFNDYTNASAATIDGSNNVISCGQFQGTIDFDPSPSTYNLVNGLPNGQVFIQKLDANGNFLWAVKITDSGFTYPNSIKTDALGNIYVAGSFEQPVDFDPGPNTMNVSPIGYRDAFILKLDANGNFVWVKHYGSTNVNASA